MSLTFWFFSCPHRRTTFPLKPPRGTDYVVCLDCGREFDYDWQNMSRGKMKEAYENSENSSNRRRDRRSG